MSTHPIGMCGDPRYPMNSTCVLCRTYSGLRIFREKPGIISPNASWVCIHGPYLYTADTLLSLLWTIIMQWRSDRNLVG